MMWDNIYLPLFNCYAREFILTIKWTDQLPIRNFTLKEIQWNELWHTRSRRN